MIDKHACEMRFVLGVHEGKGRRAGRKTAVFILRRIFDPLMIPSGSKVCGRATYGREFAMPRRRLFGPWDWEGLTDARMMQTADI